MNLAYIPDSLDTNRSDEFDTRVMKLLFDTGYRLARNGYHWFKTPPGFASPRLGEGGDPSPVHEKIEGEKAGPGP